MKDVKSMFKFVNKKELVIVTFLDVLYNLSVYGTSFALSYFITSPLTKNKLIHLLISLGILYIVSLFLKWIYAKKEQVFLYNIQLDAEQYFYDKLQEMSVADIKKYHTGYIQHCISETATEYACFFETITTNFIPLIVGIISFIYMTLSQSFVIGSLLLLLVVITFLIRTKQSKSKSKYMAEFSKNKGDYNSAIIDFIQNIFTTIKLDIREFSSNIIKLKRKKYINSLQEYENYNAKVKTTFDFFIDLIYIFVIVVSLIDIVNGKDPLSYLVFYISIIGKISTELSGFSNEIEHVVKFWVLKKQLDEILNSEDISVKVRNWNNLEIKEGIFSYKDRSQKILIPNFNMKFGDKVSVMGESGQGKTTILNILSGTYPLNKGSIIIDDKTIVNKKLDVAFISQEVELYNLSIRNNLTLGKRISDEKLINMFEDAGLMEWYSNLKNGLDEIVGEKGIKLSAGQRQRLNIIRGILIDKDVYFFDEPTSNLDKESEEKIVSMIDKYLKNKT